MDNKDAQQPAKYFVRFSENADFDRIVNFYSENRHHNVCGRDRELLEKLTDSGSFVLLEDAKGNIVGGTAAYPLVTTDANGNERQRWTEVGSMRIVLNGFSGAFDVMSAMSVLRTFLVEPPEDRFLADIGHPAVQKMAEKLGWRPFTATPEIVDLSNKTTWLDQDIKPPEGSGYSPKWYQAGLESFPVMARFMISVMDNPVLTNKKTGEQIEIDFSKTSFLKMFEPEIRDLATRDLGSVEQPAEQQNMAKARTRWMQKFFK